MSGRAPWVLVRLATLLLPRGDVRRRYRRELDSELHELAAGDRLAHALGFLVRSPALAVATSTAPLHCSLHLYHHYALRSTDDGGLYRSCRDCGREDPTIAPYRLVWSKAWGGRRAASRQG